MTTPDHSPIGLAGRITTATRGQDGPGEVELRIRGGTETFIARSAEPQARGVAGSSEGQDTDGSSRALEK